jgi:hypothetical protein
MLDWSGRIPSARRGGSRRFVRAASEVAERLLPRDLDAYRRPRRLRDARRDEESERRKHQRGEDDRASGEQVHESLLTRMGPLIQASHRAEQLTRGDRILEGDGARRHAAVYEPGP